MTWEYDTGSFAAGRVSTMTDPTGSTTYGYDRRGLLVLAAQVVGEEPHAQTYRYDADGNRALIGYPSGMSVTYTHDFAGRPLTAVADGTALITSASYLPFGPLTTLVYGNGTTQTLTYDTRYRITQNRLSAGTTMAQYDYGHDAAGNITSIHDATEASFNRDFGYDDLSRLVTANSGAGLWGPGSYSYDRMGNMLSSTLGATTQSFTYGGTTAKLATTTYDAAGNMVDDQGISARNLVAYTAHGLVTISHAYDGRAVRTTTAVTDPYLLGGGSTHHHVYSPELRALGRYDYVENRFGMTYLKGSTEFIWFESRPVAQVDGGEAEGVIKFTFSDHLGTPVLQTNASGNVEWWRELSPYGETSIFRGDLENDGSPFDAQPLQFPGQEATPGDSYNVFRWYRAGWGRYTQADPIGLKSDTHPYRYTHSNPVVATDPLGLAVWFCNRKTTIGIFNHGYLWDDRSTTRPDEASCGQGDNSGHEMGPQRPGLPPGWGDQCTRIPGSDNREDPIMRCCQGERTRGFWWPFGNDCHAVAGRCVERVLGNSPGAPGGRAGTPCDPCNRPPQRPRDPDRPLSSSSIW